MAAGVGGSTHAPQNFNTHVTSRLILLLLLLYLATALSVCTPKYRFHCSEISQCTKSEGSSKQDINHRCCVLLVTSMLLLDCTVRHGGVEVVQGWIQHSLDCYPCSGHCRHVFAGEDDERETVTAPSDQRPEFLLPWPIFAHLPLARPHEEMHA